MLAKEREQYIVKHLNQHGVIEVKELAIVLQTSEATIRRDLKELEKQGKLNRVHGGAIRSSILSEKNESAVLTRSELQHDVKLKICQAIANQIHDQQCVYIDGGTSLAPLASMLSDRDISIVTNSELFLRNCHDITGNLYFVGGQYLDKYHMTIGPMALQQLQMFNFDAIYLSCSGISFEKQLCYTAEIGTTIIKQQAMKQTKSPFLVVDDSKINVTGFCTIASLNQFEGIFCNPLQIAVPNKNMIWVE